MKKKTKSIVYNLLQLVAILGISLFLRKYVFSPIEVLGTSMEPTYHESDRVWQTSLKKPERFDIITFPSPRDEKRIIKRVVGLPGDSLRYENDQLYINDQAYDEPYLEEFKNKLTDGIPLTKDFSLEQLETLDTPKTKVIPEGKYFVLGDNRRATDDSRYFGFVDEKAINGVVFFRYYPLEKIGFQ